MPIFDQGYQHWRGPLSGHSWRGWPSLGTASVCRRKTVFFALSF